MSNPFQSPEYAEVSAARTRLKLKRVGVVSVGLFGAAAGVLMGLIAGGFLLLMSLVGIGAGGNQNPGAALGIGVGVMIMAPVFYGVAGFLGGMLNAAIYNVVASLSGGIEMEFSRD